MFVRLLNSAKVFLIQINPAELQEVASTNEELTPDPLGPYSASLVLL